MVAKTLIKAGVSYAKKKLREKAAGKANKSLDKYNIHAGVKKGPVPIKNQSLQKSTLSGRTYSISNNKLSSKTILSLGGPYGQSTAARFQDSVKDLIGIDSVSIRNAQKKLFKKKKKKWEYIYLNYYTIMQASGMFGHGKNFMVLGRENEQQTR